MQITPLASIVLGLVLAAWTFVAAALILAARGRERQARSARASARRLAKMIEHSPAIPLLVRGDGALEGPERLAAWLGLDQLPRYLSELRSEHGGLVEDELEHLRQEVRRTLKTAAPFRLTVTPTGSRRSLVLIGQFADRLVAPEGGALVWWFDFTDSDTELATLRGEAGQLRTDFGAVMGLIEAAPIPMWFRGPDLALQMVNRAYVEAVGAADAGEVIAAQMELTDSASTRAQSATAGTALEAGRPIERRVQATIGGRKKTVLMTNVPLGGDGVAGFAVDVDEQERHERALRNVEDAQLAMLDRLPSGVALFDDRKRLQYASPSFRALFQLGRPVDFDGFLDQARQKRRLPDDGDFFSWRRGIGEWFERGSEIEQDWAFADGSHLRVTGLPRAGGGSGTAGAGSDDRSCNAGRAGQCGKIPGGSTRFCHRRSGCPGARWQPS